MNSQNVNQYHISYLMNEFFIWIIAGRNVFPGGEVKNSTAPYNNFLQSLENPLFVCCFPYLVGHQQLHRVIYDGDKRQWGHRTLSSGRCQRLSHKTIWRPTCDLQLLTLTLLPTFDYRAKRADCTIYCPKLYRLLCVFYT